MNPKWTWPKVQVLCYKMILVFATMFTASFYLSGLMLVDYPDYIENKRYQIGLLSRLVNYDVGQPLESKIANLCEQGCHREWDALKREASDFSDLIAIICVLLFCVVMFKRVLVSKGRPFIRFDCHRLIEGRFAAWKICCSIVIVYMVVYAIMSSIFRLLSSSLMWPMLSGNGKVDVSFYYRQLMLAWDQLLICDKWLNAAYCVCGLFAVLAIVVWLVANVRYVSTSPEHTPCP